MFISESLGFALSFISCLACPVGVSSSLYVSCCPLASSLTSSNTSQPAIPILPLHPSPHTTCGPRASSSHRETIFLLAGCSFHSLVCPCRRGREGKDLGYEDRSFLESGFNRRGRIVLLFLSCFLFFSFQLHATPLFIFSFFLLLSV
ncbi:uncharacterized protein BDW47DRAFT_104254 [Aspergillus candidus]|uniref:Uncharacterized protein n=1 Tax=Aspergillus candidus TaxID=41067 RepID=A0A2I2FDR6_ASPCN|nr:hypothetical protein BDW47DRAFT_104254 [Aspergillus candidus]PLB38768.1 hypothetical protein BDW47DRAFT_104254 [Aspergillus candidus]